MSISTPEEKLIHDLGDIYDAEHRFLEAQQEMLGQATAKPLKTMLREHIAQTEQQIANLEQVYGLLGKKSKRVKCDAAAGLVTEGEKGMKESAEAPAVRDCVIAGAAAKVEHYEIASYRGLVTAFHLMNNAPVAELLQANLQQEEDTAVKIEGSVELLLEKAMGAK